MPLRPPKRLHSSDRYSAVARTPILSDGSRRPDDRGIAPPAQTSGSPASARNPGSSARIVLTRRFWRFPTTSSTIISRDAARWVSTLSCMTTLAGSSPPISTKRPGARTPWLTPPAAGNLESPPASKSRGLVKALTSGPSSSPRFQRAGPDSLPAQRSLAHAHGIAPLLLPRTTGCSQARTHCRRVASET